MGMNVVKGWPIGEALEDSAIPAPGVTIEEGMFLKRIPHPSKPGQVAVRPVLADNITDTNANTEGRTVFALDRTGATDVVDSNRLPFLINNAIVETDQLAAGATFTVAGIGANVFASGLEAGKVFHSAGAGASIIVGTFDGLATIADINGDAIDAIRIILK